MTDDAASQVIWDRLYEVIDPQLVDHWDRGTGRAVDAILSDAELLDAIVAWRLRSNAIGVIVGEVVIPPDGGWEFDESGEPMFDRISQTLHTSDSAAREELAEVRKTDPEARLFALTDITEEPTS